MGRPTRCYQAGSRQTLIQALVAIVAAGASYAWAMNMPPVGVYHVVSQLPKDKLTDFYGSGAYPISYPNEWDQMRGRDGHGIWLQMKRQYWIRENNKWRIVFEGAA